MKPYYTMTLLLLIAALSIFIGSFLSDFIVIIVMCKVIWALSIGAFLVTMVRTFIDDSSDKRTATN